jgi:PIN domain nuclease of toxin-antitoxin system
VKYLLDTHTFLWGCEDSNKLSHTAKKIINSADEQKYMSIASIWEFSIKYSIGKLKFEGGLSRLYAIVSQYGLILLPITEIHLASFIDLPFIHRDPFDRLLIATAKAEGITILTADENIQKYKVPFVW